MTGISMSSTISAGIDRRDRVQRLLSVHRGARRVARVVEHQLDHLDHVLVVVDDEHVVARAHACAPASPGRWIQLVRSESLASSLSDPPCSSTIVCATERPMPMSSYSP